MTRHVGKYQLIRKLAAGGMAEVYLAKAAGPLGFEKTLVVKCILPHLAQEPSFVEMFLSEAKLAARLTHPHVVQIFDFGEADGAYFLAMEYIEGPSLRTLIKRASAQQLPLPAAVCARLVSQACEGLAFAHDFVDPDTDEALGLIHRDVSPDNLLVSLQGSVKVVDFGIAKASGQSHQTRSGIIKGKLSYMPPEQLRAKPLDRRVDVYALGVVLYELLTSHKPYSASSDAALMHAILFNEPVPAEHHRPDLPEPLRRILARAIAKDRDRRYPDCHALQADLEQFILSEGRTVTARQVARLIQRAAPGTRLPVQRPAVAVTLEHTRTAPVEPGSTMLAPRMSSQLAVSRTDLDTVPESFLASLGTTPSSAALLALTRPLSATRAWRKAPLWSRRALVGALLLMLGGGLARGTYGLIRVASSSAPKPHAGPSAPPPAVPTPDQVE